VAHSVRAYRAEDLALVSAWWQAHGQGEFSARLLPPVGVVAERDGAPAAACWLYLAAGIGVCWLEYPVSRPGLGLGEAKAAFADVVAALEDVARAHDYGVMIAHTLAPIARVMRGLGFHAENRTKVTVIKPLRHGN